MLEAAAAVSAPGAKQQHGGATPSRAERQTPYTPCRFIQDGKPIQIISGW